MAEKREVLKLPLVGKNGETLENEPKKLVYVQIPKEKAQELNHVKVLSTKTASGATAGGASKFVSLDSKIAGSSISSGSRKDSLKTSFMLTKSPCLGVGTNLTFSSRPLSSISNKSRPSILGNKVTISPIQPSIANAKNLSITSGLKPIKMSLNNSRGIGSSPSIFRTATSLNPPNIIVCQASTVGAQNPSNNTLAFTTTRLRQRLSPASRVISSKPVFLQSKFLGGVKNDSPKILSQKFVPITSSSQQGTSKNFMSYQPLLSSGASKSASEAISGIKRDALGTPKRDVANFSHYSTPPPLILQTGSNAKRMAIRKTGPTTKINIFTGKNSEDRSGINIYSLARKDNIRRPNTVNFKITNGQIQQEERVGFPKESSCNAVSVGKVALSVPTVDLSEEDSLDGEVSTTFKKASIVVPKTSNTEDVLQNALCEMISTNSEVASKSYSNSSRGVEELEKMQKYNLPEFANGVENQYAPTKSSPDSVETVVSYSTYSSGEASVLNQVCSGATGHLNSAVQKPDQGFIPIKLPLIVPRNRGENGSTSKISGTPLTSYAASLNVVQSLELDGGVPIVDVKNPRQNDSDAVRVNEAAIVSDSNEMSKNNSFNNDEEKTLEKTKNEQLKPLLKWENGTGSLAGSDLKFQVNEFNALELVEDEAWIKMKHHINTLPQDDKSSSNNNHFLPSNHSCQSSQDSSSEPSLSIVEQNSSNLIQNSTSSSVKTPPRLPPSASSAPTTPVHVHRSRKPNLSSRKEEENSNAQRGSKAADKNSKDQYDICCCKNCGCYGLSSEFHHEKENSFCTITCSLDYDSKEIEWNREKVRTEKSKSRTKKTEKSRNEKDLSDAKVGSSNNAINSEAAFTGIESTSQVSKSSEKAIESLEYSTSTKFCHPWQDPQTHVFCWIKYMDYCCCKTNPSSRSAPLNLWNEPIPSNKNLFKAGMKLEGIDPRHQSMFCVLTVANVIGYRLRLHFDGYSDMFDFFCDATSPNLFPVCWCEKNGKKLEIPPGIYNFTWKAYLEHCKAIPAPKQAFIARQVSSSTIPSNFRVGMKLEADDRKNGGWTCVATVTDTIDNRVLIHYDGWDRIYDTWFDVSSPFIHPIGWCAKNSVHLYPPNDYAKSDSFNWHEYLQETNSMAVPARAFKTRSSPEFKQEMKVEAVDKRNPTVIRVATISKVKSHTLLIHFDGWPDMYDIWVDNDSPNIYPSTWCSKTGHPLQPPFTPEENAEDVDSGVSCGTQGCKGQGHIKGPIYSAHHTAYGCPYSLQNLNKDWEALLPDRFDPPAKNHHRSKNNSGHRKNIVNLDKSKPIPADADLYEEDAQKKRVRKRRKFFDEISAPEGSSTKSKIPRVNSDEFYSSNCNGKNQAVAKTLSSCSRSGNGAGITGVLIKPPESSESPALVTDVSTSKVNSEVNIDTIVHQSIFNPGYHPNPPAPVPQVLERHNHIISSLNFLLRSNMNSLVPLQVREAIAQIPGCEASADKFLDQEMDGESLLMMTQNDLVELLGIKLGPAIKIMAVILTLRKKT